MLSQAYAVAWPTRQPNNRSHACTTAPGTGRPAAPGPRLRSASPFPATNAQTERARSLTVSPYICNLAHAHQNDQKKTTTMASVPVPFMDDAKVIVSTYEELPRRRRPVISRVASSSMATARAKASAPRQAGSGSNSRRALLLAYAQQLRRRRRGGQQSGAPLLLEWGKWKAGHPVAGGGDVVAVRWPNLV